MRPGPSNQSGLSFISGIIIRSKVLMFERMLFRATRGNMLFSQAPADEKILDPVSTEMVIFFLLTYFFLEPIICFFAVLLSSPRECYVCFYFLEEYGFSFCVQHIWLFRYWLCRLRKWHLWCSSQGSRQKQKCWEFVKHLVQIAILYLKI